MPLYEYECGACGQRFEIIQKFSDAPPEACRKCGKGPVTRLTSSPAIQFKGTGWYITDYSRKGKAGAEGSASGETMKTPTTGSGESKPAADTASKSDSTPAAAAAKPASGD